MIDWGVKPQDIGNKVTEILTTYKNRAEQAEKFAAKTREEI